MPASARSARRGGAVAALIGAAVVAGVSAGLASAHASLVRTVPANSASVHGSPRTVLLEFDESVSSSLSRVALVGAKGGPVATLRVVPVSARVLSVDVPPLARDLYRIEWHTVADDDLHATDGTLVFGVDMPVLSSPLSSRTSVPPVPALEVALRWGDFTGVAMLLGALAMLLAVFPAAERRGAAGLEPARKPMIWLGTWAAACAALTGLGLLLLQSNRAGSHPPLERIVTQTTYGHAWVARESVLILVVVGLAALRRTPSSRTLRRGVAALGVGLIVPLALVSHAASIRGEASIATGVLAVHLLAASMWVGGVVALCLAVAVLIHRGEHSSARALLRSFGEPAAVGVVLLVITGVALLGVHVHSLDALVSTGYGQTLIVKTAVFLLAGAVGIATTLGLRARRAPRRLRSACTWTPRAEAALLVAVLVPAAVLTTRAPAAQSTVAADQAPAQSSLLTRSTPAGDLIVSTAVEPNRPGANFVTVRLYNTRRPAPATVRNVTLTISRAGLPPQRLTLVPVGRDKWQAVTNLRSGAARAGIEVERPGLPDTTANLAWAVPRALPSATPGDDLSTSGGLTRRPLAPILEPVAMGCGLALLLFVLLRVWWARVSAPASRIRRSVADELRAAGEVQP